MESVMPLAPTVVATISRLGNVQPIIYLNAVLTYIVWVSWSFNWVWGSELWKGHL